MLKKVPFEIGCAVVVADDTYLEKVGTRTGFPNVFLKDGQIKVVGIRDDGHLQIKHPTVDRKPIVHPKFFKLAPPSASPHPA